MTYQIVQAESYWDCIDSLRRDDAYKAHLVDALSELRRQPFRNPKLRTHEIGVASNGRKLFSSDVGGRASNRRIVWQLFNRTIVVLLYGTHAVQDRAKRMRVALDQQRQLVQIYEKSPDSGVERPYREQRARVGKLFVAWSDAELIQVGFPDTPLPGAGSGTRCRWNGQNRRRPAPGSRSCCPQSRRTRGAQQSTPG